MDCGRGWLLAKNNQGFDVPFFLKVRSVDIFYSSTVSPKFFQSGSMNASEISRAVILPPGQTYELDINKWKLNLNNNESCVMTTKVPFSATNATIVDGHIDMVLTLPIKIEANRFKSTQVTKCCKSKDLILSQQNVTYGEANDKFEINQVTVSSYKITGDFTSADLDDESYLEVTVEATANLGIYSHNDDLGQIGASWSGVSGSGVVTNTYDRAEIDSMVNKLRDDVASGKVLKPASIMDLVDHPDEAEVVNNGFILDIVAEDEGKIPSEGTPATASISETEELSQMETERDVVTINIDELFGGK